MLRAALLRLPRRPPRAATSARFASAASASAADAAAAAAAAGSRPAAVEIPPPSRFSALRDDPTNERLGQDVRDLGSLVGASITKHNGSLTLDAVQRLRRLALDWRSTGGGDADPFASSSGDPSAGGGGGGGGSLKFQEMAAVARELEPKKLLDVSRAFAHFLALSNAAESAHRLRRLAVKNPGGALDSGGVDSVGGTIDCILDEDGGTREEILAALRSQSIEIVLTAHPTEVHRRTFLLKHQRVTEALLQRDALDSAEAAADDAVMSYALEQTNKRLEREVAAMWGSDEIRRSKPTPEQEARGGLAVIETSLWDAVPTFLRKLDATLRHKFGDEHGGLPLDACPVRFASWMGGDRDGNPNVTSDVTWRVLREHRRNASQLLRRDLEYLRRDLSVTQATPALHALLQVAAAGNNNSNHQITGAESVGGGGGGDAEHTDRKEEPYMALVSQLLRQLDAEAAADDPVAAAASAATSRGVDLREALVTAHASLTAVGHAELANGRLLDTIRRLDAFGPFLAPLDIRQESGRHAEAIAALAQHAGGAVPGGADYAAWGEADKVAWLTRELESGRPLLPRGAFDNLATLEVSADVRDVLETVDLISKVPAGALGAYVISQATAASDVLAVELLQQEAGVAERLRVVPLFETLDDLNGAAATLEQLFGDAGYARRTGRRQEVMVGYSDSAKDAGRIAATWAQYRAQEQMQAVADRHGFDLVFFHGKGGTVGRGGNPALYDAILGHPPGTIGGQFRVTEQGEMITHNFGHPGIAERTLEIMTSAVLRDGFCARPVPKPEWRGTMDLLADVSCAAYRDLITGDPHFVDYFRQATPERELAFLNVGSRPAKRNPEGGVSSLRAIPWIFGWAQSRLNLPAWLGVGEALDEGMADTRAGGTREVIAEMHTEWPWFQSNLDLIEMLLSKSEPAIAAHYDNVLVGSGAAARDAGGGGGDAMDADKEAALAALGASLRERLAMTEAAVLKVTGNDSVEAAGSPMLQRAMRLR